MQRVDAHLHVWHAAESARGVKTVVPPECDIPLELAEEAMAEHGVECAVLVQPVFRGEDNGYVADCASANPDKFAAVCVVDPRMAGAAARLRYWVGRGCRGLRLRPRIAAESAVFGDPATYPLWEAAQRLGVVVSLLSGLEHVDAIDRLCQRFADVPVVIDHLGHPAPAESVEAFHPLLSLARHRQVYLKLSGFHHFSRERFPYADCWPMVRAAQEHFGPQRLIWGSDFPHVLLKTTYARSRQVLEQALGAWSDSEREAVLGGNARRIYWSGAAADDAPATPLKV